MDVFSDFVTMPWSLLVTNASKMLIAFVIALPVAYNREKYNRSIGLRTFPMVSFACCGYVLLGQAIAGDSPDALARILQGLMAGIGFIGGGAILKYQGRVSGTATAATLWATGVAGSAVALGRYDIGVLVSFIAFITLILLKPVKDEVRSDEDEHAVD